MLVGEQPGDREDLEGHPFVGPAGKLLDRALAEAGLARRAVYVTNAVKHFYFEPRGKFRLHKRPPATAVKACRPWLASEIEVLKPRVVVLLGATAAQATRSSPARSRPPSSRPCIPPRCCACPTPPPGTPRSSSSSPTSSSPPNTRSSIARAPLDASRSPPVPPSSDLLRKWDCPAAVDARVVPHAASGVSERGSRGAPRGANLYANHRSRNALRRRARRTGCVRRRGLFYERGQQIRRRATTPDAACGTALAPATSPQPRLASQQSELSPHSMVNH
jgi:hypothetical protein